MLDLSVVIPAYEEELTLADVVAEHLDLLDRLGIIYSIDILDDGSRDATARVAEALSEQFPAVRVLRHATNLGVGRSLLDLYLAAAGHWIYFTPADGQVPASALEAMWPMREGNALVVGRRRPRRDPLPRRVSSALYAALLRMIFGVRIHDVNSCKLYDAAALRVCWPQTTSSFAEGEVLVRLRRAGYTITEIPVDHRPRISGRAHGGDWSVVSRMVRDLFWFAIKSLRW